MGRSSLLMRDLLQRLDSVSYALLAAVIVFYFGTAASANVKARQSYGQLVDGFFEGRLGLAAEPRRELLNLPDPYDPRQNGPWKLHDMSLYRDRYYMYFGPAPALALFVPARLAGWELSEQIAVAIFSSAGLICAVLLLLHLADRTGLAVSRVQLRMAILGLGFCSVTPFLMRRPVVYEVAIAAGYFFVVAGLLAFGLNRPALGSLLFGLAAGCRPTFVLLGGLLALIAFRRKQIFPVFGPFAACLFVLGLYNYLRFDSWTEFGVRYQLAAIKVADYPLFDAARLKPGLWYFLLQPPDFRASFPFFFLNPDAVRGMPAEYQVDRVAGVFASMPFFGFLFGLPFGTQKMKILLGPLAATGAVLMLVMASIFAPIERYLADFCTLWLLCALAVWFWLSSKHRAFAFTGAALLSYSAAFGAAISFLGYSDKPSMPFVAPLRPDLQLNVDFAGIEPGLGEPLVVTGKPGAADFLFVRPAGPRHVTFHLDHWGRAETSGPPVPIEPGRAHLVNIRLDAGVIVEMDGREVFRDSIELYSYTDVYVGVNPLGGTTCKARFGGKISQ